MGSRGRPSALTEALAEQIVQLTRAGAFAKDAAEFCNIDRTTLWRWIERGQTALEWEDEGLELPEEEAMYADFCNRVRQARAHANVWDMNVISLAAQNDPAWAERRLKLRNPDLDKQQFEVTVRSKAERERDEKLKMFGRAERSLRGQQ